MSNLPTVADLIERLRQVHEQRLGKSLSDEKLAGQLPFSLSTFNRWKNADPRYFQQTVELLNEAGWLAYNADGPGVEQSPRTPLEETLTELALGQAALLHHFGIQIEVEPHGESGAPSPDRRNTRLS